MLHYETIAPATRELLNKLMLDDRLQDFVLVGGTSLALQLGHRLSVDLDLIFFDDINKDEPVHMADGKPLQWKRIEKRLHSMDRFPERIFELL